LFNFKVLRKTEPTTESCTDIEKLDHIYWVQTMDHFTFWISLCWD